MTIFKIIKFFTYYSILGFLLENMMCIITRREFNSGISKGPYTPLYFFGFLVILFIKYLLKDIDNNVLKVILFFILSFILLSILELSCGLLIEKIFHTSWWDYREFKLHIGKYIAVEVSLVWSLLATTYNFMFLDTVNNFILNMNDRLTIFLFLMYLIDLVLKIIGL